MKKVLVVSDTHGYLENLERVVDAEAPFDLVIHCGDVEGQERSVETICRAPGWIVAGNNDFFGKLPKELTFLVGSRKAFLTHGHTYHIGFEPERVIQAARSRGCDLVFVGHTHVPKLQETDGVLLMNPGSLTYPRQRNRKPSYGILEIGPDGSIRAEIRYLERK